MSVVLMNGQMYIGKGVLNFVIHSEDIQEHIQSAYKD